MIIMNYSSEIEASIKIGYARVITKDQSFDLQIQKSSAVLAPSARRSAKFIESRFTICTRRSLKFGD